MSRMNIRISGLGGQGAVTAAHLLAMAANKDGKFSISNPFFGAEKRMAQLKVMPELVRNASMIGVNWFTQMLL